MSHPTPPTDDLDNLIRLLDSDDLPKRQEAIIALARIQDERVVAPLIRALQDDDATIRANAIAGLGINRAQNALDALLPMLKDAHDIVRERAVTALAQIGTPVVFAPLLDMLDDKSAWVRNRAVYVLGASRNPDAIDSLMELLDHADASTQGVAAWALGSLGAKQAMPSLLHLLKDKVASVRGNAAWALGEIGDNTTISPLIGLLKDKDPEVRGKTAWALGNLGQTLGIDAMVKPLVRLLDDFTEIKDSSAHTFVCQYVAEALTQIGTPQALDAVDAWRPRAQQKLAPYRVQEMIRALGHPNAQIRDDATQALVKLGHSVIPQVLTATQHKNVRVRQNATKLLGMIAHESAVSSLIMALADGDSGVWSQAVASLAKISSGISQVQTTFHNTPHTRVKWGCGLVLWRVQRAEEAFPYVLLALQDSDIVIQGSAITSLWLQPDARALATLQLCLTPEDTMMNRYIIQALQNIGTPAALHTVRHWLEKQSFS
jgi:HEAT repeat protein